MPEILCGAVMRFKNRVPLHTAADVKKAKYAGSLAAEVLAMISEHIRPGITTDELDRICHDFIVHKQKAKPANVGYHGFPKTVCASPNHVVCHGIPDGTVLNEGDILNIDVAVIKDGWFGDTSRMYTVGKVSDDAQRLVDTTYHAMMAGIQKVRAGATLGDVGHAIQKLAEEAGYSIVREYCGHGIGKIYHDEPTVLHYGRPGTGMTLQAGMIFTVEPMLNAGQRDIMQLKDGWTVVTKDNSLSAQWEHMVLVKDGGFEILTPWPDGPGRFA
jgi:methionyl aminopeptidase